MSDAVVLRSRWFSQWCRAGAWLSLGLLCFGCAPEASTKSPTTNSSESTPPGMESRTQRNLQNAIAVLQPDKLGIVSGPEQAIAVLNEWAKGAKREAEQNGGSWESSRPHPLLKSLPQDWGRLIVLEHFVERDATFLRDCLWASKASKFAAGDAESDLDVVVNLFEYVVRNVELISPDSRRVPVCPFDATVLGRGTAADRAWLFAELLRQRTIDAVILSPARPQKAASGEGHLLVGVLLDKDVMLFDPALGLPLPADIAAPKSAFPRRPLTLRQAAREPELLTAIANDSGEQFPWTSAMLQSAQVELICHTEQLSSRMRHLQSELAGEQSVVVADPLEDYPDQPGLWSRVARHPAATWSADEIVIWSYPEVTRDAAAHLTSEQQKELSKLAASLGAPQRVSQVKEDAVTHRFDLEFTKPERVLMRLRMQQVIGQWTEAVQGYVAVQLYDVDPPTAKGLERVSGTGRKADRHEIAVVSSVDKQNLRLLLMQPQFAPIRRLHLAAGDDACYWLALCQFEQNRMRAVASQCKMYSDQHSSGAWVAANQTLWASALARQNKLKEAIRALKEIDEDNPSAVGHRVLMARWKRLLESAE